ncbi:MAG: hypothetical protein J0M10_15455 [Chitinophagales bacterium]|nr:hypothetical protein [Chitinophagales bacterium]
MKNVIRAGMSALLLFAIINLISCSKDRTTAPAATNNPAQAGTKTITVMQRMTPITPTLTGSGGYEGARTFGNLTMVIAPLDSKSTVIVSNDIYNSGPIPAYEEEEEGRVYVRQLQTGTYKVQIIPHTPGYPTIELNDIQIMENMLTDLGTINVNY